MFASPRKSLMGDDGCGQIPFGSPAAGGQQVSRRGVAVPYKLGARAGQLTPLAVAMLLGMMWFAVAPVHAATSTVVSLTFDDGSASQYSTLSMLSAHGMKGTYYINSALVGSSSYYMTWSQLHDLYNAGNEIGGHTLHHVNLKTLSTADATTEVCDDRKIGRAHV